MTMKNGFSTINRLLGKQRDSSSNLSKSTSNLSVTKSNVNINDSSQLHQNRITPLPIATSNAPFEQTFRITVLLPRDQLYVARLGAKVRLEKLLQLVCENKQLDADRYEFQHPADPSQIFSCDLTIGAVGLSEIRLCNKKSSSSAAVAAASSDYNNTLRLDVVDVSSSSRRNSFSSSKFSRNSKNISNTPSLYSSNYSLNSMSSSGIDSSNYRNISPEIVAKPPAPVAPVRKKRLAPKPPSQNVTPATTPASETSSNNGTPLPSTSPDTPVFENSVLSTNKELIDCNGNTKGSLQNHNNGSCVVLCENVRQELTVETQSTLVVSTNEGSSPTLNQPEPSPRRRVQTLPHKKPVPLAPPRSASRTPGEKLQEPQFEVHPQPVPLPRVASRENLISDLIQEASVNSKHISKILMNQSEVQDFTPLEGINLKSEETTVEQLETIHANHIITAPKHALPSNEITIPNAELMHANHVINESKEAVPSNDLKSMELIGNEESNLPPKIDGFHVNLKLKEYPSNQKSTIEDVSPERPPDSKTKEIIHTENSSLVLGSTDEYIAIKPQEPILSKEAPSTTVSTSAKSITTLSLEPLIIQQPEIVVASTKMKPTPVESEDPISINDSNILELESIKPPNWESKEPDLVKEEPLSLDISCNSSTSTPNLETKHKSFIESSSEDDEAIKVYNLKLGKTIVKTLADNRTTDIESKVVEETQIVAPDLIQSSTTKIYNGNGSLKTETDPSIMENASNKTISKNEDKNSQIISITATVKEEEQPFKGLTEEPQGNSLTKEVTEVKPPKTLKPAENSMENEENLIIHNSPEINTKSDEQNAPKSPVKIPLFSNLDNSPENHSEVSDEQMPNSSPKSPIKKPLFSTLERLGADEDLEFKQHVKAAEIEIELLQETTKPNTPTRSSSFLSRNQTATEEYVSRRRRSSSELSIGESPSLQSIGLIKSILLNSKKSTSNGVSDESSKTPPTECDIQSLEEPSPKSNNIFKTTTNNNKKPSSESKVYRYSGPPNIQFSTWNERPKVQVAIQNEPEYKVSEGTSNSSNQKTTPITNGNSDLSGEINNQNVTSGGSVLDLVRSTHKVTLRETRSINSFEKEVEKPQPNTKPKFSVGSRTSWSVSTSTTSSSPSNGTSSNQILLNRPTLRPTSMAPNYSNPVISSSQQPIFGQGTLRKTGYKDKMLSPQDTSVDTVDDSKPKIVPFTYGNHETKSTTITTHSNKISQITPKTNHPPPPTRTASAPAEVSQLIASCSVSVPAAPPPPPIIRAVVTKQKSNRNHIERSISADPRDQLLSAIRNFKRDELKNTNI